jgi:Arm DNA-binding domain
MEGHMLTVMKLGALKPRAAIYRVADGAGLCVEVRPDGGRSWRYRYRFAGNARMLSLGTYPQVSLAQARTRRDEARSVLQAGLDPSVVKTEFDRLLTRLARLTAVQSPATPLSSGNNARATATALPRSSPAPKSCELLLRGGSNRALTPER